ncbi:MULTISPECIES: hypothetical protein [Chitinophagaceae]
METKIDNSLVAASWQQITEKIGQLNQLKNNPAAIGDIIAVVNGLHSLLLNYSVEKNRSDSTIVNKRIAVVMPSVFTGSTVATINHQEHEVMAEEIKEMGPAKDYGVQTDYSEAEISLADATVEDAVQDSISKMKEMEIAPSPDVEENVVEDIAAPIATVEVKEEESALNVENDIVESSIPASERTSQESTAVIPKDTAAKTNKQYSIWEAYSSNEIPTLAQQDPTKLGDAAPIELQTNEALPASNTSSGIPIKDLKKAISISDRYLFINELFRGEESAYERSIKTINNFNVYQEARYWIDRELKVKLGWNDKNPTVRQFDALVQRRFS